MGDGGVVACAGDTDMVVLRGGEEMGVLHVEADTLLSCILENGSLAEFEEEMPHIEGARLSRAREVGSLAESGEDVMMDVSVCFRAFDSSPSVQRLSLCGSLDT
ncbi:hypothetical protein HBI56_175470 [Parastagonospora nodorum]|nr:hypothetical protein HBH56_120930 [Parastagonospora nodorum]KAH3924328.1 hypothetical protein HBH54_196830 [Parastagonospora nodorum]KAH3942473.1 hypothetical protein HBH53_186670 [Parastagonospora nodorum]KAH3961707.1 hypothetical protein HBH51_181850 [Parastagonospora nodorum]KAH3968533.1 hypothetical protein HBH52_179290 [Parastagonospora nodorum]